MFAANENVSFFDVNLAEHHIREGNPGAGGWPSIRYFRKVGAFFQKKNRMRWYKIDCI
jgi:hypothetical protein